MSRLSAELKEAGERLLACCEGRFEGYPPEESSRRWKNGPFLEKAEAVRRLLDEQNPPLCKAWGNLEKKGLTRRLGLLDLLSDLPSLHDERINKQRARLNTISRDIQRKASELVELLREAREVADEQEFLFVDDAVNPLTLSAAADGKTNAWLAGDKISEDLHYMDVLLNSMSETVSDKGIAVLIPFDPRQAAVGRQKPGKSAAVRIFDEVLFRQSTESQKPTKMKLNVERSWFGPTDTAALLGAALGLEFSADDIRTARKEKNRKT